MVHQTFNDITFYQTSENDYFRHNIGTTTILMHRYVWEFYNCKIPKGYEVHHIDGNKANNSIDNLKLVSAHDHRMMHSELLTDDEREWRRNNLNMNARPKAIEWHKSDEGKAWHKQQYERTKDALHQQVEHACLNCGKVFMSEIHTKYCSNACKSAYRRKCGADNIESVCIVCGKTFVSNKYHRSKTCSPSCRGKYNWLKRKI